MSLALKILFGMVVSALAPIVTLVYRRGWFDTPDDTVSPRGMYEDKIYKINEWVFKLTGRRSIADWVSDWYWLGFRNRAYGYDYALKPEFFKGLTSYNDLNMWLRHYRKLGFIPVRVIWIEGFREYTISFGLFHVIAGYRLRPIWDEAWQNKYMGAGIPFRKINMDARPIFSIRAGAKDD